MSFLQALLCQCGCGQPTRIAKKTSRRSGHVKGHPLRYVHGHTGGNPIKGPARRVGKRRRAAEERVCEGCGKVYLGIVSRPQRYCSHACQPPPPVRRGQTNNRYNGGLCFYRGRLIIVCRDGTTMLYSRGVMAAKIGRLLRSDEIVHHRNGQTDDDREENLRITTRAGHINMHRADLMRGRGYGN